MHRAGPLLALVCIGIQTEAVVSLKHAGPAERSGGAKHHAKLFLSRVVSSLDDQLDTSLATIGQRQQAVRETILYVDKVASSFGSEESIFHGKMDQADIKMATKILRAFNSTEFAGKVHAGLKSLTLAAKHLTDLSDKRVKEFVTAAQKATGKPRLVQLERFFNKERSLISTQVGKVADVVKECLKAVPEELSTVASVSVSVMSDMLTAANVELADRIFSGNGTDFCQRAGPLVDTHLLPTVQRAQNVTAGAGGFAESNVPEVAAEVSSASKQLSGILGSVITMFQRDVPMLTQKVCDALAAGGEAQ